MKIGTQSNMKIYSRRTYRGKNAVTSPKRQQKKNRGPSKNVAKKRKQGDGESEGQKETHQEDKDVTHATPKNIKENTCSTKRKTVEGQKQTQKEKTDEGQKQTQKKKQNQVKKAAKVHSTAPANVVAVVEDDNENENETHKRLFNVITEETPELKELKEEFLRSWCQQILILLMHMLLPNLNALSMNPVGDLVEIVSISLLRTC